MAGTKAASSESFEGKLPLRAKIGYGGVGLSTIANTMLVTWQLFFYTTFAGLDVQTAGVIIASADILAAFVAPVWGYISDRMYRTSFGRKIGRRRGTILLTIPGLFFFMLVQFYPGMPVWGYALANFLYWTCNAGVTTIQYVLPSEMSSNATQRSQLVGLNQITTAVSTITLSMVNTYLFSVWGSDTWTSYFNMALMYAVLCAVFMVITVLTIKERPYDETTDFSHADADAGTTKVPLLKRIPLVVWNYVSTFSVREFRYYLVMYLSQILFRSIRSSFLTYFLIYSLQLDASGVSLSQGVNFAFGIAFVLFFMWVNNKVGAARAYRYSTIEAIVSFLAIYGLVQIHTEIGTAATITAWIVLQVVLNIGLTGVFNACDYCVSFIPDVDEVLTGKRREGQYASINSTIDNIFRSIETVTITTMLGVGGFVQGADVQPEAVANLITNIFVFVPIVFCIMGIWASYQLKLTDQNRHVLQAEIERLRAGGSKADVDPETKRFVEQLTGYPYEKCWGNNRVINFSHVVVEEAEAAPAQAGAESDAAHATAL